LQLTQALFWRVKLVIQLKQFDDEVHVAHPVLQFVEETQVPLVLFQGEKQ
jgi:hypothetical protein